MVDPIQIRQGVKETKRIFVGEEFHDQGFHANNKELA